MTGCTVTSVCGKRVLRVLETWRVVDRWWTKDPLERTYADVELDDGARAVVMREKGEAWQFIGEQT